MMPVSAADPPPLVTSFLDLVAARAMDEAADLAVSQLHEGRLAAELITDLLAPVQCVTGRRWHRAEWTVAHEHQATAVTDSVLHRLAAAAGHPPPTRGHLAVVCAEGEWHTLASRMAAELLRLDGWHVVFLGGSLPVADLASWLAEARPDGMVVSCSLPTALRGVHSAAAAAADVGVPVVAGGAGLGVDGRRAAALGVTWTGDLDAVDRVLAGPPPVEPGDLRYLLGEWQDAALRRPDIVGATMQELRSQSAVPLKAWQLGPTVEGIGWMLDYLSASALARDSRLFTEFLDWLTVFFTARRLPEALVPTIVSCVAAALPRELSAAGSIVTAAAAAAGAGAGAGAGADEAT